MKQKIFSVEKQGEELEKAEEEEEEDSETVTVAEPKYHPRYRPPKEQKDTMMEKNYYPGQPLVQMRPQYNQAANNTNSAFVQFSQRPRPEMADIRYPQYYQPPNNMGQPVMPYQYQVPMAPYQPPPVSHYMVQRPVMMQRQIVPQQGIISHQNQPFNNFMPHFIGPATQQRQQQVVNNQPQVIT